VERIASLPKTLPSGLPEPGSLPIFDGVEPALFAEVEAREYGDGDLMLASGAEADRLIVLLRGTAIVKENGTKIVPRSGVRLLGELAFIDGEPRSASVFADGRVSTYELPAAAVEVLLTDPGFLRNLARELTFKLREATSDRAWHYATEDKLFGAFRAHASEELLQELLATGETGTPRQADIVTLFSDIRGFTDNVRQMQPEDLARDLAAFLDVAVDVVHAHGGMVDKFIGDAVMAIWGYKAKPDDRENALAAGIELVARARDLTLDGEPLRIGVGIESGLVTLGVIGTARKRQFTAIGHSVNLAARLEAETKPDRMNASICVGPDFAARLADEARAQLTGPFPRDDIRGVGPIDVWTFNPERND
jgi:class 3 adenylate cyclase